MPWEFLKSTHADWLKDNKIAIVARYVRRPIPERPDVRSVYDLAETTDDWYVQDRDGNVWYFGEATKELDGGKVVSTEGSWEGGVDGAEPGIYMPANPVVGQSALQEFYAGQAEDHFVVLLTSTKVKVPLGSFSGALMTAEWTPLEPDVLSEKFYVKGTGQVREVDVAGGDERLELTKIVRP